MRCFEIGEMKQWVLGEIALNNNMRCFEIFVTVIPNEFLPQLNNNMRCFEMEDKTRSNIKIPVKQ